MPADFTWKQGASAPAFSYTCTRADGSTPNLAGASIQFNLRALTAAAPLTLTGPAVITNPAAAIVQYTPSALDTSAPGMYMGTFTVTLSGAVEVFPQVGYLTFSIEENLTTPGGQQLVSLPDVKDYVTSYGLQASDRAHDQKLTRLINSATPVIENIVGPVIVREFEEWHDGGGTYVMLRRRPSSAIGCAPVITLIACSEYSGPIEWALAIVASPDEGQLYSCMLDARLGRVVRRTAGGGTQGFPHQPQAVHVIYTAGQQTVPENVRMATLEAIRHNYETTQPTGRGLQTVSDEDAHGRPLPFFLPPVALEYLAPMRRHPALA